MPFAHIIRRVTCFLLFVLPGFGIQAQSDSVYYSEKTFAPGIDTLRTHYGTGKVIPAAYELPVLTALSHYPELRSVMIEFTEAPIGSTLAVRPRFRQLQQKDERSYIVYINNNAVSTGFTPDQLSFNQQVGVFGHELAHILYFQERTAHQLRKDAAGFYFRTYRRKVEKRADQITIDHGLGWSLLDFTEFVRNFTGLSKAYQQKKKKFYYETYELRNLLRLR